MRPSFRLLAALLAVAVLAGQDAVDEVGPVEAANQHVGIGEPELLHDVGRRGRRVARVRQVAASIKPVIHPIVNAPFEALVDLPFEIRAVSSRRFRFGRSSFGESDPLVVGAEDRRARHVREPARPQTLEVDARERGYPWS